MNIIEWFFQRRAPKEQREDRIAELQRLADEALEQRNNGFRSLQKGRLEVDTREPTTGTTNLRRELEEADQAMRELLTDEP